MNRRFLLPLLMLALLCATSHAQTSKRELWSDIDKLGSNYYSYPGARYRQTPPPAGYEAFYISHFGRHGSRYLTSNNAYHRTIDLLEKAETQQALTRKGRKLLKKLRVAYADAKGKGGELSLLGGREHEGIAQRACTRYPGVFANGAQITARCTSAHRCEESMNHFLGEVKRHYPYLQMESGYHPEDRWYMSNHSDSVTAVPGSDIIRNRARDVRDSLRCSLDLSPKFITDRTLIMDYDNGHPEKFTEDLYDIAEDMQCLPELGMKRTFRKYFTKEQLYTMFLSNSISWLISPGYYKGMTPGYKRGYNTMLYSSMNPLRQVWQTGGRVIWLAHYTTSQTSYEGGYYLWQASSTGRIDGILSGNPHGLQCANGLFPQERQQRHPGQVPPSGRGEAPSYRDRHLALLPLERCKKILRTQNRVLPHDTQLRQMEHRGKCSFGRKSTSKEETQRIEKNIFREIFIPLQPIFH